MKHETHGLPRHIWLQSVITHSLTCPKLQNLQCVTVSDSLCGACQVAAKAPSMVITFTAVVDQPIICALAIQTALSPVAPSVVRSHTKMSWAI